MLRRRSAGGTALAAGGIAGGFRERFRVPSESLRVCAGAIRCSPGFVSEFRTIVSKASRNRFVAVPSVSFAGRTESPVCSECGRGLRLFRAVRAAIYSPPEIPSAGCVPQAAAASAFGKERARSCGAAPRRKRTSPRRNAGCHPRTAEKPREERAAAWGRRRTAGITRQAMPHIRPKQLAPFLPVRRSRCGPKMTGTSLSADCALQAFFADWHSALPPRRTKNRERSGLPQKKRNPVSHPRKNGLGARQMFSRPNRKSHNKKPRIRKSKTPRASRKTPADNSSPDIRYGGTFPLRNARPAPIIAPPRCAEPPPTKHIRRSASGKVHPATVIRRPRRSVRPRPNFAARRPDHRSPDAPNRLLRSTSGKAHPAKYIRRPSYAGPAVRATPAELRGPPPRSSPLDAPNRGRGTGEERRQVAMDRTTVLDHDPAVDHDRLRIRGLAAVDQIRDQTVHRLQMRLLQGRQYHVGQRALAHRLHPVRRSLSDRRGPARKR